MKPIVKYFFQVFFLILIIKIASAQSNKRTHIIGFTPSRTEVINGWGIGWLGAIGGGTDIDSNGYATETNSVEINGLYTDVSPLPVMTIGMGAIMIVFNPDTYKNIFSRDTTSSVKDSSDLVKYPDTINYKHRMNGLTVSLMEFGEDVSLHGVQVTGGHYAVELKGVSISLTGTGCNRFKGVMISSLFNWTDYGSGIQIGIFNRSYKMKGIQLGLWNKIGKRGLPIINMNFR